MYRTVGTACVAFALFASTTQAQVTHTVDGRVARLTDKQVEDSSDTTGMTPVANVMVTLHRIGKDAAGPVDSMRTRADGKFKFSWKLTGAADAVYFASVTYSGIAYFTTALRDAATSGDNAQISVFDTTSRSFPLVVQGRHLVVSAVDSNDMRTIVEVFELSNDKRQTLVTAGAPSGVPTWSVAIPQIARDVRSSEGEISADAFKYSTGRISVFAPIAPGIKQLSFSYRIPASSFPLPFVIEHGATVLEVLIEEPRGEAIGAKLAAVAAASLEGRKFRRFLAQDVPSNAPVTIDLASGRLLGRGVYFASLLAAIGVAMLLLLMRAMQRRRPLGLEVPQGGRAVDVPLADRLAREIADLDVVYKKQAAPSEAVTHAYNNRREELKDALGAELARTRAR